MKQERRLGIDRFQDWGFSRVFECFSGQPNPKHWFCQELKRALVQYPPMVVVENVDLFYYVADQTNWDDECLASDQVPLHASRTGLASSPWKPASRLSDAKKTFSETFSDRAVEGRWRAMKVQLAPETERW